jgi:hypothetical protein
VYHTCIDIYLNEIHKNHSNMKKEKSRVLNSIFYYVHEKKKLINSRKLNDM